MPPGRENKESAMQLTDSHCHLDFESFDHDRGNVIQRACSSGVSRMVSICTRIRNEPDVRAIAETSESVYYAVGTHPHYAAEEPMATVDELARLAMHPKFVAIGETGLDYHYTKEIAVEQKRSLRIHIEAARRTGLPLIVHSRDADEDMADIMTQEHEKGAFSCVMHCFSSGPQLAKTAVNLGFYLSMSGIVAFPRSQALREIFAAVPVDRILVETDSPYLAPPPFRGKRNEPAHVIHTAKVGAEIFGMSIDDFASQTEENFERLFANACKFRVMP